MTDDALRDEIAFIRQAIEEGRGWASVHSPALVVWGVGMAIAYAGTYGCALGWWRIDANWIWAACVVPCWLYSMRGPAGRLMGLAQDRPAARPMARALQMLWLGCGIFLTIFAVAVILSGEMRDGWFGAVIAGVFGIGFFVSASLCNLPWVRLVAVGWWVGALAIYALRHRLEVLPLSAVLMLALMALPGFLLLRGRPAAP